MRLPLKAIIKPPDKSYVSSLNVKEIWGRGIHIFLKKEYLNHLNQRDFGNCIYFWNFPLKGLPFNSNKESKSFSQWKNNFLKFVCWSWTALKENEKVANKFSVLLRDSANTKYHYPNKS